MSYTMYRVSVCRYGSVNLLCVCVCVCVCVCAAGECTWLLTGWASMTFSSIFRRSGQLILPIFPPAHPYPCTHRHAFVTLPPFPPSLPSSLPPSSRMRMCFSVTEAEVERAKNVFKTSLFMQLDGT